MSSPSLGTQRTVRIIDLDSTISIKTKLVFPINEGLLFNRWVPPAVIINDDTYAIDKNNYDSLYTICPQHDIVKHTNNNHNYRIIQDMLISSSDFNKYDFTVNKGFNVIDYITGVLYECRILYAYYNSASMDIKKISWRVYVDHLKINIIMSTSMIKTLLLSNYSNYIVSINMNNGLDVFEKKKKKSNNAISSKKNGIRSKKSSKYEVI